MRQKSLPCQNLRQRQTIVAEFSAVGIKAGRRSDRGISVVRHSTRWGAMGSASLDFSRERPVLILPHNASFCTGSADSIKTSANRAQWSARTVKSVSAVKEIETNG
ncbi:hypothetical protein CSB69_0312 [Morganella morganii]|nr:hypothetical protein CSB69_0312 [Morganella morganii]